MHELDRELELFSQSVDIVDRSTFEAFKKFFEKYATKRLGVKTYEIMMDGQTMPGKTGQTPALVTSFAEYDKEKKVTVALALDADSFCHVSYSYVQSCPLWIISAEKDGVLEGNGPFVDLWCDRGAELPGYMDVPQQSKLKTSIIYPLCYRGSPFGVMNLEFSDRQDCTELNKGLVKRVANAVAQLMWLNRNYDAQTKGTSDALSEMLSMLDRAQSASQGLKLPQVFIACSGKAKGDVKGAIDEVMRDFKLELKPSWWSEIDESGEITKKIRESIRNSAFGICYLSEPAISGSVHKFQDNPNVLFEAGMFQMLSANLQDSPSRWIPIREESSGPAPFDFRNERMVTVQRTDGDISKEAFMQSLRSRIQDMIK